MTDVALDHAVHRCKRLVAGLNRGESGRARAFGVVIRRPGDVVGPQRSLRQLRRRIAGVDAREHRRPGAVGGADLIVQRVREADRVAELVDGDGHEVHRARHGVGGGIGGREAEAVGRLGVELHVVVEDRAGLVEAGRELDVAIAVDVSGHADRARDIGVGVAVDQVAVDERRVFDQAHRWRRGDRGKAGGGSEGQLVDKVETGVGDLAGGIFDPHLGVRGRDHVPCVERGLENGLRVRHGQERRAQRVRDRRQRGVHRVTHGKRAGILANWHEPADHLSGNRRRCVAGDVDLLEEAASLEAGAAKRHDGERHDKKGERFSRLHRRLLWRYCAMRARIS